MDACVECTHCRVVMTSWSAPGSPIRYFQCPFCQRTHSSLYGEVFRRRAGARVVEAPPRAQAAALGPPTASPEEVRWARVKASAARWFARLEADERRCVRGEPEGAGGAHTGDAPDADPADVVEVAPIALLRRG